MSVRCHQLALDWATVINRHWKASAEQMGKVQQRLNGSRLWVGQIRLVPVNPLHEKVAHHMVQRLVVVAGS